MFEKLERNGNKKEKPLYLPLFCFIKWRISHFFQYRVCPRFLHSPFGISPRLTILLSVASLTQSLSFTSSALIIGLSIFGSMSWQSVSMSSSLMPQAVTFSPLRCCSSALKHELASDCNNVPSILYPKIFLIAFLFN